MAEQQQAKTKTDAQKTKFDVWHYADGLHEAEEIPKWIFFKHGFVRVRKENETTKEGWADEEEISFYVPAGHSCEVLGGPEIKFTRALSG